MARLKIVNVGPIRTGYEHQNGFIEFSGVTIFIGNQGSGKSTVAKLYSTLSWIEKALVRNDFTEDYVTKYNRFQKKYLAYQNIHNYLSDQSYIEYIGDSYHFIYSNNQLTVRKLKDEGYSFPKIMYVPAERNLVSSIDRLEKVKNLPSPLYTFYDEYADAKSEFVNGINLPILNTKVVFSKQGKPMLVGEDYQISLVEASSGFHSIIPLVVVTQYLSKIVNNELSKSKKEFSREEEIRLRNTIAHLMNRKDLSEEVLTKALEQISARYFYKSFINIIEEPEQNLYPSSQKSMLFELLKYKNENESNRLVITTHSPFIINYITLAIKAHMVKNNVENSNSTDKLSSIVPLESTISGEDVVIYELDEKEGIIKKLVDYKGLPSDENFLNASLEESNDLFVQLQEIEKGWR